MKKGYIFGLLIILATIFSFATVLGVTVTQNLPADKAFFTESSIKFQYTYNSDLGNGNCTLYNDRVTDGTFVAMNTLHNISNNSVENYTLTGLTDTKETFHWKVTCNDGTNSTTSPSRTVYVNTASKLVLNEIEVKYYDKDDEDVPLNDKLDNPDNRKTFTRSDILADKMAVTDIKQGSTVELEVEIKNLYTTNIEDVSTIEDITVSLEGEVGDDDVDEEEDIEDAKYKRTEKGKIAFEIDPEYLEDNDNDDFTLDVTVQGTDENGTDFEDTSEISFTVKKDRDEIWVRSLALTKDTISCDRNTELRISLSNAGTHSLSEVRVEAVSEEIGLADVEKDIDLGDDISDKELVRIPIKVGSNVAPGTYNIDVKIFKDGTDDQFFKRSGWAIAQLKVDSCVPETTVTNTNTGTTSTTTTNTNTGSTNTNTGDTTNTNTGSTTTTDQNTNTGSTTTDSTNGQYIPVNRAETTYAKPSSEMDNQVLIILLVVGNVLLLAIGVVLILKFVRK